MGIKALLHDLKLDVYNALGAGVQLTAVNLRVRHDFRVGELGRATHKARCSRHTDGVSQAQAPE